MASPPPQQSATAPEEQTAAANVGADPNLPIGGSNLANVQNASPTGQGASTSSSRQPTASRSNTRDLTLNMDRLGYDISDLDGHGRLGMGEAVATPPYKRNMSQLTLPPEYEHDHHHDNASVPPLPSTHPSSQTQRGVDEKRPEDFEDESPSSSRAPNSNNPFTARSPPALTLQTSDNIIPIGRSQLLASGGADSSQPPSSIDGVYPSATTSEKDPGYSGLYDGETLVHRERVKQEQQRQHQQQQHTRGQASVHYPDGLGYASGKGGLSDDEFTSIPIPTPGGERIPGTRRSSMSSVGAPPSIADTENDDEPDEFYDWSDEEDLVDQEAKFEAKIGKRKKAKTWGTRRIATFLFSTLIGTTFLTCVLVAVPITLHFVYYRPHPTQYRTMVTDNVSAWFYWAAANLLISWYLAVIIDVIPHIATWFVKLSWGTLPESFKTKIGLYDSIKGWIKPVFYAASAWVSWVIIFANIFGLHNTAADVTSDAAYTDRMVQVVELCFFIVLLYCIEKIALQFVAFTFHRVAYQDRLNDVNKALKVFDHLKDYRPKTRRRTPGASTSMAGAGFASALKAKSGRITPPLGFGRKGGRYSGTVTPDLEGAYTADTDGEHDSDYFSRSAKPKPMPRPKRHGTLSPEREYSDRDDSGTEKKKRRSWLHFGGGGHGEKHEHEHVGGDQEKAGYDHAESIPMKSAYSQYASANTSQNHSPVAGPSRTNSQDFNTAAARAPRRQGTNDSYSPRGRHHSRGGSPAGSGSNSPHTYPPTSDAHLQAGGNGNRRSVDLSQMRPTTPLATSFDRPSEEARNSTDGQILATAAKALKTVVLHDARNIKGKDTTDADASFTITSPHEAKKLARNLYMAFRASKKRTHLIPSDFYPAYPRQEDAKEAFQIFDKDGNENITRAEIKTTIMKVYKERRFLARSLKDVGAALVTLDWIMLAAATVMLFFIALSVFNVQITKLLTSFYTLGIALSFIFKNSAANGFDAVMFLFVSHPFDTGDRCFINGENLVVKKMGLFATIFTRSDGTHTYYFNTQLTNVFIINARRSNKSAESCTIQIDWRTPLSKIDELEKAMNHWIDTDENRWFNTTSIMLQSISYQRSLEMTIGIAHNSNWQDWGQALTRRTAFHAAVNHYCREIGITFSNSPQPVYFTKPGADQPVSAEEMEWEDEPQSARLGIPETSAGTGLGLGRSSTRAGAALRREASTAGGVLPRVPPALFFQPPKDDLAGLRKRKKADGGAANC